MERRVITEEIGRLDTYTSYTLGELVNTYGTDVKVLAEYESDYYDNGSCVIRLTKDRLENDQEYNFRIEKLKAQIARHNEDEKRRKLSQQERDRKDYERMKKKYGWD